jgi:hypothetical protein
MHKAGAFEKTIPAVAKAAPASESVKRSVLDLLKAKYALKSESIPVTKDAVKLPESVLRDIKRMTDQWVHMSPEAQRASLSPKA